MTDIEGHVLCGGAGDLIDWKSVMIGDHTALNVAINLKYDGMEAALIAAGMPAAKAHRKTKRYGRRIQRFIDELYDDLEADGINASEYDPHDKPHDQD